MVFLTMLIMRYRVEIKPEPQFALETFEQKQERILRSTFHITMACVISVIFNELALTPLNKAHTRPTHLYKKR